MAKIEYSCKRKKDFVTFIAIAMFVVICLLEVYLIIFIKMQQEKKSTIARDVMKQQVLRKTQVLRTKIMIAEPRAKNAVQECEIMLARDCLDHVVRYLRRNSDNMSDSQIKVTHDILENLSWYIDPWDHNVFLFREQTLDIQPILRRVESRLDQAAAYGL